MSAIARPFDATGEPNKFERVHGCLMDALVALDRGHLRDALKAVRDAGSLLEVEEEFRCARRAGA